MDAFFQAFGMALVFSAACWLALPKGTAPRGLLFAKLVGVFLALAAVLLVANLAGLVAVLHFARLARNFAFIAPWMRFAASRPCRSM